MLKSFFQNERTTSILILSSILLLSFLLRIWGIEKLYWPDERITLSTLDATILKNPLLFGYTTNLPLFFYFVRIWNLFFTPHNIVLFRLIPVIFSLLNIVFIYEFLKRNFSLRLAIIVSLIFAFSPLQIYYAQELRPYSLAQLLLFGQFFFLVDYLKDKNSKSLYPHQVFVMLAFLTHYAAYFFYFIQMAILFAYRLYKKDFDKRLGASLLVNLLFSVILYFLMSSNPNFANSLEGMLLSDGFNPLAGVLKIKEAVTFYYWYGLHYYFVALPIQSIFKKSIMVILALAVYQLCKKKSELLGWLLLSFIGTLIFVVFLEFLALYPFGGRHIMIYAPFIYIVVGSVFESLTRKSLLFWLLPLTMYILFIFHLYVFVGCEARRGEDVSHEVVYKRCADSLVDKLN